MLPPPTTTLAELQSAWATEFPGSSLLLLVLRSALALADWHARLIQANFLQLHRDLHLTSLPMSYWDPFTHSTFLFLQKHNSLAQQEFRRALRALQSSYQKPEPLPPIPTPPPPPPKVSIHQTVIVTVKNGVAHTEFRDMAAAFICNLPPDKLEPVGIFTRQVHSPTSSSPIVTPAFSPIKAASSPSNQSSLSAIEKTTSSTFAARNWIPTALISSTFPTAAVPMAGQQTNAYPPHNPAPHRPMHLRPRPVRS